MTLPISKIALSASLAVVLAIPVHALPARGAAAKPAAPSAPARSAPAPSAAPSPGTKAPLSPTATDGGFMGRAKGSAGTKMSDQQKANLQNLQNDLLGIKADSQVTPEQKDALAYSLMAMADGATKPDQVTVDKLASDLSEAMADGTMSNRERVMLANDVASVMNSANIPQSEVDQAVVAAQNILGASGISKNDVQLIVKDLKAIAAEGEKNAAAAKAAVKTPAVTAAPSPVQKDTAAPAGRLRDRPAK